MAVVDPIADMLSRIRNAHSALHAETKIPLSKIKESIAGILKDEGFIEDYSLAEREITIKLKYVKGQRLIRGMRRISTPGRRVYVPAQEIPEVLNGLGICILSTSKGLLAGAKAKADNVGGELLCEIW
jgi:small subunit ribosomal protein S8